MGTLRLVRQGILFFGIMDTDMRAAGNSQGKVILFNPSNTEHTNARTIFDPITALAPSSDYQTYAIGSVYAALRNFLLLIVIQVYEWINLDSVARA